MAAPVGAHAPIVELVSGARPIARRYFCNIVDTGSQPAHRRNGAALVREEQEHSTQAAAADFNLWSTVDLQHSSLRKSRVGGRAAKGQRNTVAGPGGVRRPLRARRALRGV